MSISTKKGDHGETSLLYGVRVPKTHIRVLAYSSVDELNAALGLCRAHVESKEVKALVREIQGKLVQLMGELAAVDSFHERYFRKAGNEIINSRSIQRIEECIEEREARGTTFKGWTYPGESIAQAFFEQARTVCRRAERKVVALRESKASVRSEILIYLNRLSDLLWLLGKEQTE